MKNLNIKFLFFLRFYIHEKTLIEFSEYLPFYTTQKKKKEKKYCIKNKNKPKESGGRRMEMEESIFLTLGYTTNNIVQAQKQKYSPREQDRKPRGKPRQLWACYL